jgi:signal peptidase II
MWLGVSALVILLDWQSKHMASESLVLYSPREIFSWLNMTLAHNYGAAFSFLNEAGGWQRWFFAVLASAVCLILLVWLLRLPRQDWLTGLSLGLIIGGAIGNLIDRVQLGYVVDFIDVSFWDWHFPAFNVADSAITVGVVLLLLDSFLQARKQEVKPK